MLVLPLRLLLCVGGFVELLCDSVRCGYLLRCRGDGLLGLCGGKLFGCCFWVLL